MRFLNWCLHLLIVALMLCAMGRAQTQGNRPDLIDSYQSQYSGATAYQIPLPDGVNTNEELVVCVDSDTSGLTISDTLGNTWTKSSEVNTPAPHTDRYVFQSWTKSSSTGADTITLSGAAGSYTLNVGRFKNLSGVIDGTNSATSAGNGGGGPVTFSTSITTTVNGDLITTCGGRSTFGNAWLGPSSNVEYVSQNAEDQFATTFEGMQHTGAFGAQSQTYNAYNDFAFGSHATFAAISVAFKPTTIAVADTAMPDAAANVAYSAQLHGVGGIAGLTYACTGLPSNGLSLNTSTGVISGATPTAGSVAIGCTVTDGTNTSATDSLTITIGTGFNTPIVRQSQAIYADGGGGNSGTFLLPVSCGDVIAVFYNGSDTHGGNGWVLNAAGAQNKVTDSQGNVYARVGPIAGTNNAPLAMYVAQTLTSGTDTISITHTTTAGSGLNYTMADIGNVQKVVDIGTFTSTGSQSSSPISFTDALTTVVPNEMLFVAATSGAASGDTFTFSPLSINTTATSGFVYNSAALGYTPVSSASTYTASFTDTTTGPLNANPTAYMAAFRPALPNATCSLFTGPGEKIRRQAW